MGSHIHNQDEELEDAATVAEWTIAAVLFAAIIIIFLCLPLGSCTEANPPLHDTTVVIHVTMPDSIEAANYNYTP